MPELPEVETIVRQLRPKLAGQRLLLVELLDDKLSLPVGEEMVGSTVVVVERLGKQIALNLRTTDGNRWLVFHLRMTGSLIWSAGNKPVEQKHLRAILSFEKGKLLFYDLRRFGTIILGNSRDEVSPKGLEPLSSGFTPERLGSLIANSRQVLKSWLLRQDRLVGIGNIYASEIPFTARLSPHRPVNSLSINELRQLHRAIVSVLELSIEHRGTTFSDYRDSTGKKGGFQKLLRVYGRDGKPCPSCGTIIQRTVIGQRSTYFCPTCQPAG
ncbi:bifunctional DNA-formamidopyrimidine glycosylase/DNA-(apurinic or apyrimidinic site) lyase [bacterium]|nr:bifunctional DNA-formamidopyrimidine glycosylase/DNA-(apurinic or apyrimidinic site) lyase [bacterium]